MGRRKLVLGGGGVTGVAWEIGLITGLAGLGIDLAAVRGPAGPRHGRGRGRPGHPAAYRVIAMATGPLPTLMAVPALPVTIEIGVTVPEPLLTT